MWVVALRRSGTSSDGCLALSVAASMVIFTVPPNPLVTGRE